jgi:molybdopterin-guanine dinucleotide biosynthesis protein
MIHRALIHISGPKNSGKTSFVEACLNVSGPFALCVRAERDGSLKAPKESAPKDHTELQRYKKAKASSVVLYRFPESSVGRDDFFLSAAMRVLQCGLDRG